ncbi:MAG: addiction module protein [Myxococcales bacterium]|nr:addiction module protein [Myxococcales bacterium]MCA9698464.1 addiction module protein [Myxococcales bacterium]
MTAAAKKVFEEALALSDSEREELVEILSQSLPPTELSTEWKAELARRIEKIESGRAVLHDAGAHAQALRAKFG